MPQGFPMLGRGRSARAKPGAKPGGGQASRRRWFISRLGACLAAAGLAVMGAAGCGPGRPEVPIHGEITFSGAPVEHGTISIEPADGKGKATGGEIKGGRYDLTGGAGPLPGRKIVRITAIRKTGRTIEGDSLTPKGVMLDETEQFIPDIYNTRSTLTCEVGKDLPAQIDFRLQSR